MAYKFRVNRMAFECATIKECSETYSNVRDGLGLGASRLSAAALFQGGKVVGHISYNGRVWAGSAKDWTSQTVLLYDNRREALSSDLPTTDRNAARRIERPLRDE
jgi:hypothetical protein